MKKKYKNYRIKSLWDNKREEESITRTICNMAQANADWHTKSDVIMDFYEKETGNS